MNVLLNILKFIIDSRLLISLASSGIALSTFRILGIEIYWPLLLLVFTSTFSAYTFPLFLGKRRFSLAWCLYLLFYGLGAIWSVYLIYSIRNTESMVVYSIVCFCTLFYYIPLLGWGSLREVPFLKAFLISFTWTVATTVLPISFVGLSLFESDAYVLVFQRFVFLLAIAIPFDVRDLKNDLKGGLKTIPVILGLKKSLFLSFLLLVVYLGSTVLYYGLGNLLFARMLCVFFVLILIQNISYKKTAYYYSGFLDGSLIFNSILIEILV